MPILKILSKIIFFLILFVLFLTIGLYFFASRLSCVFYPPACYKIADSLSNEPISLILKTGIKSRHQKDEDIEKTAREIEFVFPRSYITWGPYLTEDPQSYFSIETALPNLQPYNAYKFEQKKINTNSKIIHENRLPISFRITWKINPTYCHAGFCGKTPTDKSYNYTKTKYGKKCVTETPNFECKHKLFEYPNNPYPYCRGQDCELLTPINMPRDSIIFIECGLLTETIESCQVNQQYDNNIAIEYSIRKKHLSDFTNINNRVLLFIKNHIVRDEIIKNDT